MKAIFKATDIDTATKMAILEKTIADDKSDIAQEIKETCIAYIPDSQNKAKVWA